MQNDSRQEQKLWLQAKQIIVKTITNLKIQTKNFPATKTCKFIVQTLAILSVAVATIQISKITFILPVIFTSYFVNKTYNFGYKLLPERLANFLIRYEVILPKPVVEKTFEIVFTETEISGMWNWQYKDFTGTYQVVGGESYRTSRIIVICDQNNAKKDCFVQDLKETIYKIIE